MPLLLGPGVVALSFVLWGLLPLYYQFLPTINMWELLSHRVIWSVVLLALLMRLAARPVPWATLRAEPRQLLLILCAGPVMSISWCMFTWCLTTGQVLATSLAFFMTPLFNIVLAVLFLKERLTPQKHLAVALALAGLAYMLFQYGELPWFSLIMGGNFAVYGLIKKKIHYPTDQSLYLEALVQLPLALLFVFWLTLSGHPSLFLDGSLGDRLMLMGSAPATLIPVGLFCYGMIRTRLSTVGLLQYIEPSLAFLLAVFWFGEHPDPVKEVGFMFVWAGLLVSLLPLHRLRRRALSRPPQ
ncbi:EamA family transporter RarD [Aeromonas schubertii]|uniref:EamA family transporter RarD n=1 Tax=Aeromonas TaxID=642 RepID=UPI0010A7D580|nr:EamA family transporter RarD [Aeromonas schubertii]MBZ6072508.1 EamA family transporter RarD [Aeromonas schubertii]QCG46884.1 EamA family transporter RarD [Aeromonas schubertii]